MKVTMNFTYVATRAISVRTVIFDGSGGIAMKLTPYAIHSRRGGTVDKMATKVDPDTVTQWKR